MAKPEHAVSRYMSFAPALTPEAARDLLTIAHFDGTARVQTVDANVRRAECLTLRALTMHAYCNCSHCMIRAAVQDEPWLHALLLAIMRRRGYGVLANTSFNSRGHPILNTAKTALELLDSTPELDKVLIEDWLFSKP